MRNPSAAELIRVWELGQGRSAWLRGLLLLAPLFPNSSLQQLGAVALGTRNAILLALRGRVFGPAIEAIVSCPRCTTAIEFSIATGDLLARHERDCGSVYETQIPCAVGESELACRLFCTDDLRALAQANASSALAFLGARAIVEAPAGLELDDPILETAADLVLTADPLAEMRMGVSCSQCEYEWSLEFDIVDYLWKEFDSEVARLFDDVHRLSSAYGWSESVILTMSAHRRRQYLDRAC